MRLRFLMPALAGLVLLPATASAQDTPVEPDARGGYSLAAEGGYMVWAAPNEDTGWHLVIRKPDGTTTEPRIRGFSGPPTLSTGTIRPNPPGFRVVATYGRDDGDAYQLDLASGRETRLRAISSKQYRETSVSISGRNTVFARSGGPRSGLYVATPNGIRRLDARVPRFTATNGSRVAYSRGNAVVVRRLSGEGRTFVLRNAGGRPRSIVMTRYRVSWLGQNGRVFQTPRFGGSGPTEVQPAVQATRNLPPSTNSIALERDRLALFLDGEGIKRANPRPFRNG